MTAWSLLPEEVRALLSPSFSSVLLWKASMGYKGEEPPGLPVDLSFLILPMVLHRKTREELPSRVNSSLALWLDEQPLFRAMFPERARDLVPHSRAAVVFGGKHGLFDIADGLITPGAGWARKVNKGLAETSEEVKACAKKAEFVGRWFANSGSPGTVLALIGVRP